MPYIFVYTYPCLSLQVYVYIFCFQQNSANSYMSTICSFMKCCGLLLYKNKTEQKHKCAYRTSLSLFNTKNKRPTTLQLWSQTSIRTKAGTAYLPSNHRSSGHVIASYHVDHMTNFPLLIDSEEVLADAGQKFK